MYVSAVSFGAAWLVPQATSMFMTNSMLLWWTLDRVPLPLVIKPNIIKKALQWRSELRAPVQSYVNQAEIASELNLQRNYFTVSNGTFVRRTANLEKTVNMN